MNLAKKDKNKWISKWKDANTWKYFYDVQPMQNYKRWIRKAGMIESDLDMLKDKNKKKESKHKGNTINDVIEQNKDSNQ